MAGPSRFRAPSLVCEFYSKPPERYPSTVNRSAMSL